MEPGNRRYENTVSLEVTFNNFEKKNRFNTKISQNELQVNFAETVGPIFLGRVSPPSRAESPHLSYQRMHSSMVSLSQETTHIISIFYTPIFGILGYRVLEDSVFL